MNQKLILKKILFSMSVAWVWLFLVILHIYVSSHFELAGSLYKVFNILVMLSCFLIYPYTSSPQIVIWPFFMQFLFWWVFGLTMIWLYNRLKKTL